MLSPSHLSPLIAHNLASGARARSTFAAALLVCLVASASGCTAVSRQSYDRDIEALRLQTDWLEAQKKRHAAEAASWQAKHGDVVNELSACKKTESDLEDDVKSCQGKLKAIAADSGKIGQLLIDCEREKSDQRSEFLAERDKNVKLMNRLGAITRQLEAMRKSIQSVRGRLADLIRAGKLRVEVKNGFLVIGLESDILFDTGKAELKSAARPVLLELAEVLRQFKDKRFQVAGHTDRRGGGDVNWPLSVGRALSVVQFLIKQGRVEAGMLSAGGYAHYLPTATTDDDAGWSQNRRVEFLLMPDLTELYKLAEGDDSGDSEGN